MNKVELELPFFFLLFYHLIPKIFKYNPLKLDMFLLNFLLNKHVLYVIILLVKRNHLLLIVLNDFIEYFFKVNRFNSLLFCKF